AYDTTELYTWLLAQKRTPPPAPVTQTRPPTAPAPTPAPATTPAATPAPTTAPAPPASTPPPPPPPTPPPPPPHPTHPPPSTPATHDGSASGYGGRDLLVGKGEAGGTGTGGPRPEQWSCARISAGQHHVSPCRSRQQLLHHLPAHVRQSKIPPLVVIRQLRVI